MPADRHLLIEAAVVIVAVRAALSLVSFSALRRARTHLARTPFRSRRPLQPPMPRIVWAVDVMSRALHLNGCLIRALTADAMLVRHQQPSRLRIGVAKATNDDLEAHAWVESDGKVIIGNGELQRFTPLAAGIGDS